MKRMSRRIDFLFYLLLLFSLLIFILNTMNYIFKTCFRSEMIENDEDLLVRPAGE